MVNQWFWWCWELVLVAGLGFKSMVLVAKA